MHGCFCFCACLPACLPCLFACASCWDCWALAGRNQNQVLHAALAMCCPRPSYSFQCQTLGTLIRMSCSVMANINDMKRAGR